MSDTTGQHTSGSVQSLVRPWRGLLTSIRWTLRYWQALRRLRWNVCPRCNSDSPEFWECPCCLGYDRTAQGMPCEDRKLIWHNKWMTEDRYEQRANAKNQAREPSGLNATKTP